MKKTNILILLFLAASTFSCCLRTPTTCFPAMTPVNMYSGNIQGLKFNPNSDFSFNIKDNAIGLVDSNSACLEKNALYDYDNHVYIFADGSLPTNLNQALYIKLRNANWSLMKIYELDHDAEILVDEFEYKIYVREQNIKRRNDMYAISEAKVNGETVYKYWDEYYVEDYKNFLDYHYVLRPSQLGPVMIDKIRGINKAEYITTAGQPNHPVLTIDGRVDYTSDSIVSTTPGITAKIYFKKPGAAVNYRIKHVYHTVALRTEIEQYYNAGVIDSSQLRIEDILIRQTLEGNSESEKVINVAYQDMKKMNEKNNLMQALKKFYDKYLEKNIEGYTMCSGAVMNLNTKLSSNGGGSSSSSENLILKLMADIDSPPLPTGGGDGPQ
jgi:hypothetical protein